MHGVADHVREPGSGKGVARAALMVGAASLILQCTMIGKPIGNDLEGLITGGFTGVIEKNYMRAGFAASGGEPRLFMLPTTPRSGPAYANHPPLLYWVTYAAVRSLGTAEWVIRLPAVVASCCCAILLVLILGRLVGASSALIGGAVFVAAPMSVLYGHMASFEPFVMLCGLIAAGAIIAEKPRYWVAGAAVFTATMFDWAGCFLVLGLVPLIARGRGAPEKLRRIVALGASASLAVASVLVVFASWEPGGLGAVFDHLRVAAGIASGPPTHAAAPGVPGFLASQVTHVVALFGYGLIGVTVIGGAWGLLRRWEGSGFALCWVIVAGLHVAVFHNRARDHEFWSYYALPAVATCSAYVVHHAFVRSRVVALVLCTVILAECMGRVYGRCAQADRVSPRAVGDELNLSYGEDWLLLVAESVGPWKFYANAWIYDGMRDRVSSEELVGIMDAFDRGDLTCKAVAVFAGGEVVPKWLEVSLDNRGFRKEERTGAAVYVKRR